MREALAHLRILLGTRRRAAANRIASAWSRRGLLLVGGGLAAVAVVLVLGDAAAPALLEVPGEVATGSAFGGDRTLPRGTLALEAAFWLGLFSAAVTSFRVMEILYRRKDLRAVEAYPIRLPALYVDRLLISLLEAVAVSGGLSLFFVPLVWHGEPTVAGLAALILIGGLLASTAVSFGLQVWAGRLNARAAEGDGTRRSAGVYGGPGQVFMFSPGIALAASAGCVLFARLGVGELLAAGGSERAFGFAAVVLGAAALASLVGAYRLFVRDYPTMCARFREADTVTYTAPVDYQESAFSAGTRLEGLLPESAVAPFRVLSLQYGRGYSLLRYSYVIGWLFGGLALAQWSREAFPPWAVVMAPALVAATAANPWYRIVRPPLRTAFGEALPLAPSDENAAALALAARELALMSVPYALLVAWADWSVAGPGALLRAAGAVCAPLALNAAVVVYWRFATPTEQNAFATALAAAVALLAVAVVSVPVAVGIAAAAALASTVAIAVDSGARQRPSSID